MYNVPEQLLATNKENLESFVEFAGIAASGAEKLLDMQLKIAKAVFADTVKHAKTVVAAKDVQELTEIQDSIVQPSTITRLIIHAIASSRPPKRRLLMDAVSIPSSLRPRRK